MEVPSALDQADVDLEGLEESKGFTPGRAKTPRTELPKGLKTLSSLVEVDSEMSHAAAIGHFSFHRVGYEVPIKVDKGVDTKMVLDGVSGEVLPGEMLAVVSRRVAEFAGLGRPLPLTLSRAPLADGPVRERENQVSPGQLCAPISSHRNVLVHCAC
jgi:hypothetical protein